MKTCCELDKTSEFVKPDSKFFLTLGDSIAFIYPDFELALKGTFLNGTMMAAKPVKIVAERCKNGIKQLKFAKPAKDAPIFKYQRHVSLIRALFHLQFSFILIDGLFCGPIFVHNKLSKSSIKRPS